LTPFSQINFLGQLNIQNDYFKNLFIKFQNTTHHQDSSSLITLFELKSLQICLAMHSLHLSSLRKSHLKQVFYLSSSTIPKVKCSASFCDILMLCSKHSLKFPITSLCAYSSVTLENNSSFIMTKYVSILSIRSLIFKSFADI